MTVPNIQLINYRAVPFLLHRVISNLSLPIPSFPTPYHLICKWYFCKRYWFHTLFYYSYSGLHCFFFSELQCRSSSWSPCLSLLPFTLLPTSFCQILALFMAFLWTKSPLVSFCPGEYRLPSTAFKVLHNQCLQFYLLYIFYALIKPEQDLNFPAASDWWGSSGTLLVVQVA